MKIENLSGEEDSCAERGSTNAMKRDTKGPQARHQRSGSKMKAGNHSEYQQKSLDGRKVVPVSGDKEQHASCNHDGAECNGKNHGPAHSARIARGLEGANAIGGLRVEDTRLNPLLQLLLELFQTSHRPGLATIARSVTERKENNTHKAAVTAGSPPTFHPHITVFPCLRVESPFAAMTNPSMRKLIIAIDGPAGAGKSTVAARVARRFGYVNLESGAMYRALALKAIDWDASFEDEEALVKMARESRIVLEPTVDGNRVLLDGVDVSARVRERDVTEAASKVSVHPRVREWMVARQREMGLGGGVVMEGRDIGTKVFPDADLKIFLDADPAIREQRRLNQQKAQQKAKGAPAESMAADLRERDQRDRTRAASPLVAADDAVLLDSTHLSEDEVVARIERLAEEKLTTIK